MNILSYQYLIFVILAFFIYWLLPKKLNKYVLLILSLIFIYLSGILNFVFIIGYITLIFLISKLSKTKQNCIIGIIISLIPLIICKYYNPIASIFGLKENIISIVGISFVSFRAISFVVDSYRCEIPDSNYIDYALYMIMFPQYISGPIEKASSFIKDINKEKKLSYKKMLSCLLVILFGYFIKLAIADRLIDKITYLYENSNKYGPYCLISILAYSIYIYCDFMGYSYIACGVGGLFGYNLTNNFKQPYLSMNIRDFWKNWHKSLNNWFRDYIYIPLGGNKNKYINILIVFIISGIWHGVGIGFIIWGLLNGLFNIIGQLANNIKEKIYIAINLKDTFIYRILKYIGTYLLISFTWLFFDQGLNAIIIINNLLKPFNITIGDFIIEVCNNLNSSSQELLIIAFSILILLIIDILLKNNIKLNIVIPNSNICLRYSIFMLLIILILVFGRINGTYDSSSFIYFKF